MRTVTFVLAALLVLVQYALWFGSGGYAQVRRLQAQLDAAQFANDEQKERNARLQAEVEDLRQGLEMVEDRARGELGMVKPDEILVQLTRNDGPLPSSLAPAGGGPGIGPAQGAPAARR